MAVFHGRDILSLKDFERADFDRLFEVADELAQIAYGRHNTDLLAHKTLLTAFYEPSTRTRLATEAAMRRLGGQVIDFSDARTTHAVDFFQGAPHDVVHMLESYGDVIAMRHFEQGAPAEAAHWATVPVINCGDGWGEHPTEVLSNLYTTWKELGTIDGLTFLLAGDMRRRTMHSLLYALSQFDAKAYVVGPPEMALTPEFMLELDARSVRYEQTESVEGVIGECDVIYTEPASQLASGDGRGEVAVLPRTDRVTRGLVSEKAKSTAVVFHALPRMGDLEVDLAASRHARSWEEAFDGVVLRMALLALVLGAVE